MAIFHLNAKVISRGKGQSAIAAAAYRSGERLRDEQADEQKFYQARAERIVFTDIMAPKDAPEWAHDRNDLWNEAERAEKRKDAQLARELEIALPHELTDQQREWLVKDYAREQFVRKGYAVDIAIHAPDHESDERNYHAHLMVTMRQLGPEGFAGNKDRSLNTSAQLGEWREEWADLANRHLERHGHAERIDHRTLERQGIDREPTTHVGYAASEMAQRGAQSDRMDELQGILDRNELKAIDRELDALDRSQLRISEGLVQRDLAYHEKQAARPFTATEQRLMDAYNASKSGEEFAANLDQAGLRLARTTPLDREQLAMERAASFAADNAQSPVQLPPGLRQGEMVAVDRWGEIRRLNEHKLDLDALESRLIEGSGQALPGVIEARGAALEALPERQEWVPAEVNAPEPSVVPSRGDAEIGGGFYVASEVAGQAGERLVDFVGGIVDSFTGPPPRKYSVAELASDPAARRAHYAQDDEERVGAEALARMREDLQNGKRLQPADVRALTHEHLLNIKAKGDDYLRQIIESHEKEQSRSSGLERERER